MNAECLLVAAMLRGVEPSDKALHECPCPLCTFRRTKKAEAVAAKIKAIHAGPCGTCGIAHPTEFVHGTIDIWCADGVHVYCGGECGL